MSVTNHRLLSLTSIQKRALTDSQAWFPGVHATDHDAVIHFALGIAGEVGELVNLVKKINRGSTTYAEQHQNISDEMADVLIYLCDMATTLDIDLSDAVHQKRAVLIKRWGDPSGIVLGDGGLQESTAP